MLEPSIYRIEFRNLDTELKLNIYEFKALGRNVI